MKDSGMGVRIVAGRGREPKGNRNFSREEILRTTEFLHRSPRNAKSPKELENVGRHMPLRAAEDSLGGTRSRYHTIRKGRGATETAHLLQKVAPWRGNKIKNYCLIR